MIFAAYPFNAHKTSKFETSTERLTFMRVNFYTLPQKRNGAGQQLLPVCENKNGPKHKEEGHKKRLE